MKKLWNRTLIILDCAALVVALSLMLIGCFAASNGEYQHGTFDLLAGYILRRITIEQRESSDDEDAEESLGTCECCDRPATTTVVNAMCERCNATWFGKEPA